MEHQHSKNRPGVLGCNLVFPGLCSPCIKHCRFAPLRCRRVPEAAVLRSPQTIGTKHLCCLGHTHDWQPAELQDGRLERHCSGENREPSCEHLDVSLRFTPVVHAGKQQGVCGIDAGALQECGRAGVALDVVLAELARRHLHRLRADDGEGAVWGHAVGDAAQGFIGG